MVIGIFSDTILAEIFGMLVSVLHPASRYKEVHALNTERKTVISANVICLKPLNCLFCSITLFALNDHGFASRFADHFSSTNAISLK